MNSNERLDRMRRTWLQAWRVHDHAAMPRSLRIAGAPCGTQRNNFEDLTIERTAREDRKTILLSHHYSDSRVR